MSSDLPRPSVYTPFLRRFTDEAAREVGETIDLYRQVQSEHSKSLWAQSDVVERINSHCAEIVGKVVTLPSYTPFLEALDRCQLALIGQEETIISFPAVDWSRARLSMKEQVDLNRFLRAKQHFLANQDRVFELWITALCNVCGGLIQELPSISEDDDTTLTVPLFSLLRNPGDVVDKLIGTLTAAPLVNAGLFTEFQTRSYENQCRVSKVVPYEESRRPLVFADECKLPPDELIDAYLGGTPFAELFKLPVPFEIPLRTRFEHHWIVAPPGAGKSTTLQYLIMRDLELVAANEASIVVMESNRDLIKAIEGLKVFAPGQVLDGKLVTIDAEDIEWPIALNLFDVGLEETRSYSAADQEAFRNSVLSQYEYIFNALLSADLTSRQHTLFQATIELLLSIPSATLDTLIDLMQPGGIKGYQNIVATLEPDVQRFFQLKFNSSEATKTKDQVVDRLFAVKRNRTLSRMFSAPKSKFDFFTEMGGSKVILINLPQSLLQDEGVEITGRFFISMILLAAHKRQLLPKHKRLPCFLYIDECQDFIKRDPKIPAILDQARKLNLGLILAHQRLQQLQPSVLDALYGATAIKFASKVSDSAAHALARDMRTTPEFILNQPAYHFAAYVRGVTDAALSIRIPDTDMNKMPRMTASEHAAVRQRIRERYAISRDTKGAAPASSGQSPSAKTPPAKSVPPTAPDRPAPSEDDWRS
jgi:hypothetical protein